MESSNQLKLHLNSSPHNSQIPSNSSIFQRMNQMKPIFKRHVTWRCIKPSDISYINKYKPKMLSRLSISHLRAEKLGTSGIRNLRKALKDSRTVSFAHFDNPIANTKQLEYLLDSTNHWRDLFFLSIEDSEKLNQRLTKAISRLGRCKQLCDFPLPGFSTQQDVNRKTAINVYQQIKKLHRPQRLNLHIPLYNNPNILKFRLPHSLTSLSLSFKSNVPQQRLSLFVTGIQHCNLLEHLILSFSREYPIELSDAEIWASFFQNTPKSLKKLHLSLSLSADQQLEGIQAFIGSLKHLKDITSLNLTSFNSFVFNQPLAFGDSYSSLVFNGLQSLTQLESLELKFYFFKKIENNNIKHLSSMLQCLKRLKNFSINLPPLQSPDEGLISISQALIHISNLKTLDLKSSSNFTQKSLQTFFNNIAHFQHLNSLCLDFYSLPSSQAPAPTVSIIKRGLAKLFSLWNSDNVTPFFSVFSDMRNFTQLSTLKLQLSAIHHSPQEWNYLALALQQFKKLSSLHLHLPQFNSAKNFKGLHELLSCLKDLPELTQLGLYFEGSQISDKEIKILSCHLVGCQSLSTLNLRFTKAAQLKDESLYSLLPAIRGLLTLKSLTLLFQKEGAFGDKAVDDFLEGLVVLKDLSRFYFLYNIGSMFRNNNTLLPTNLQGYENLRHLIYFVVDNSRYI